MKKLILFSVLLVLFSSCEEFLTEKIYTQITTDYIISTPEGMADAVTVMYTRERDLVRSSPEPETNMYSSLTRGTDISTTRSGTGVDQYGRYFNFTSVAPGLANYWRHFYKLIGYANLVINASANVDMTNPIAIQAVAEAKAFRAHSYFHLIRRFDNIYLTTRTVTPENINDSVVYQPANPDDVYKLIREDLDYAIENLSVTTKEPGRFTKGAVRHIRAQVAMWDKDWDEAIEQCEAIFASGIYSLLPLNKIFEGADLNHSEAILVQQWAKTVPGSFDGGTYFAGHRMHAHFMAQYHNIAGLTRSFDNGAYAWGRIYPNPYLFSLYDKKLDKRYTEFYKHHWFYDDPARKPANVNLGDTVKTTSPSVYYLSLHPSVRKFMDRWTVTPDESNSYKDIIIYRLAETYIMAAESYLMKFGGDHAKTKEYYNKTWMRAGNPQEMRTITLEMIIEEHARELAFEGARWPFLKRLGILVERVQKYGGEFSRFPNGTVAVNDTTVRKNIRDFHVRWPIPQAELDQMGSTFPQNEGYN